MSDDRPLPVCPQCLSNEHTAEQPPVEGAKFRRFQCHKCGSVWHLILEK
jgi:transposase-like protein